MRLVVPERIIIDGLVWEPGHYEVEDPYWAMRLYERLRAMQHEQQAAGSDDAEPSGGTATDETARTRRRRG